MVEYVGQQPVYHGATHFTGNYHHDPLHGNYGLEPHHDDYHDFKPDDHYHHDDDADIVWVPPQDFMVPTVEYTPRRYEEYVPRWEKNIVTNDYEYEAPAAEAEFTSYNLFPEGYDSTWKPFYDPYHDELHKPVVASAESEPHPDSDELSPHSEHESDGNYVAIVNPVTLPAHSAAQPVVVEAAAPACDCAAVEAERDVLKAELTMLRLQFLGHAALEEEHHYAPTIRHGLADAIIPELVIGDGSEYLHPGLDRASNYYDPALSPFNDPYYHDATEFYAAQTTDDGHSSDVLGFFDFVTDPARLSHH